MTEDAHVAGRTEEDPRTHARVEEHAHPAPAEYVKVAVALAIVTALEVALFYIEGLADGLLIALLMVLMAIKFAMVAMWFMHLRFDNKIFSRLFITGILLAIGVFTVVLVTIGVVGD
ncbi:MAG TPA: cytochrome C oxidase subunit IV family protein [Actinomycetota bacterium]